MTAEQLSALLHEHVRKGDPVDVANLAMMLHQNGQWIEQPPAPDAALVEAFDAGRRAAQAEAAELAGALDEMIKEADLASWGGYFPATAVTRAVEALAKYRKGGE